MHRRRAAPRFQRPAARESNGPIAIAGLVLLLLAVGGSALYYLSKKSEKSDPGTLCVEGRPPSEILVLLIDASEGFSEPQRKDLQNRFERVLDGVPPAGLVELYAVDRSGAAFTEPLVHLCNPGTGADLNRLYQNPALAAQRWKRFRDTLQVVFNRELDLKTAPSSPIFEAVQAAAIRSFGNPRYDNSPKRLLVVSDLIQHMPGKLSMYSGLPEFAAFATTPYFSKVRSNLDGVSVTIYYIERRDHAVQGIRHVQFWEDFFTTQGAQVDLVDKLYGGP